MSISPSYVDGLELRIKELGEQVEKLTKERDELLGYKKYWKEWLNLQSGDARQIAERAEYADALEQQLAALAEQNEKLKDALKTVVDDAEECTDHDDWTAMLLSLDAYHIASTCIEEINELPDLAVPVLNRVRAEAKAEENEAIIAAANALENIASTSSSTRIRRVANDALTAIRARRNHG